MFAKFKGHEYCRVIFITSAIFYFHSLFCSISDPNFVTQELAKTQFSNFPGFNTLLNSGHEGRFFEMESALYILFNQMRHQDIVGFDLEIAFSPSHSAFNLGGETVLLRSTEFDVITTNFVIECKNCAASRHGKSMAQFIKEKDTLKWMRWVAHKIQRGKICIKHNFSLGNRDKSVFTLSNFSKKSRVELALSCSWVVGRDSEECIGCLKRIILMLSSKKLIVFFRNCADPNFERLLIENQIDFIENIKLSESIFDKNKSEIKKFNNLMEKRAAYT